MNSGVAPICGQPQPATSCWDMLLVGEYGRAMQMARDVLATRPHDVDALVTTADLALEAGNRPLAERMIHAARGVAPQDERVVTLGRQVAEFPRTRLLPGRLLNTGHQLAARQNWEAARAFVERALHLEPGLIGARDLLEQLLARSNAEAAKRTATDGPTEEPKPVRSDLREPTGAGAAARAEVTTVPADLRNELLVEVRRARRPADLVPAVRRVLTDESIDSRAATHALAELAAVPVLMCSDAHSSKSSAASIRVALVAYQPWFGFDYRRLTTLGLEKNLLMPLFVPVQPRHPTTLLGLTSENFREYRHRDVLLWPVCHYRVCYNLRIMPESVTGDEAHLKVIREMYAEAVAAIDSALSACAFYRPETVVIAQGYDLLGAALRHVAVNQGIRVVALENVFRRDRLLWDDTSGITVNRNLARNYYWRYAETLAPEVATKTVTDYFAGIASLKSLEHYSPAEATAPQLDPGNEPLIVFLGQVGIDSSVLYGRQGFRNQVEIIVTLADYAIRHGCRVCIKLHPKESTGYKYSEPAFRRHTAQALETDPRFADVKRAMGDRLVLDEDNRYNTYDLIHSSSVCVTLNSQAGLEALALGKETIVCGQAFYAGLGFSHEAPDAPLLAFILGRILSDGHRRNDATAVNRFFHTFAELYCVPKTEESLVELALGRPEFRAPSEGPLHQHLQT